MGIAELEATMLVALGVPLYQMIWPTLASCPIYRTFADTYGTDVLYELDQVTPVPAYDAAIDLLIGAMIHQLAVQSHQGQQDDISPKEAVALTYQTMAEWPHAEHP